jgi:predicted nucleotidyltransferase
MGRENEAINGVILQKWQPARQVFENTPQVIAAWAFGSAKDGEIRPGGDLDIAVLFEGYASRQAEFVSLTAREYEDEMALLLWGLKNRSRE